MEELKRSERRLREAVNQQNFDEVSRAAEQYRAEFDRHWSRMALTERHASPLPGQAAELMRWVLGQVKKARRVLRERRRKCGAAGLYLHAGRHQRRHTWGTAG
jgi:hypothetical protein